MDKDVDLDQTEIEPLSSYYGKSSAQVIPSTSRVEITQD